MRYDVFISHAGDDKDAVARPLAAELERRGYRVWFDEATLTVGDSLRRSIDRGLSRSRYAVVIVSRSFLEKEWPNRELDGLVARDDGSTKVILPVWHNVSREQIAKFSPTLADKLGVSTSSGIERVADEIERAMRTRRPRVIAAVTTSDEDPIAGIRATVLTAAGRHELCRCMYEVESYLARNPHDVEARLLKDTIECAIRFESMPRPARMQRLAMRTAALLLLICMVTFGTFYTINFRPPAPPPPVEYLASPGGDHVLLEMARTQSLQITLSWTDRTDIDLSVLSPSGTRIWFRNLISAEGGLDQDVTTGPGSETITVSRITTGTYRVVVHNFAGRGSPDFQLRVIVNGELYRVYKGRLAQQGPPYFLELEMQE